MTTKARAYGTATGELRKEHEAILEVIDILDRVRRRRLEGLYRDSEAEGNA